MRRTSRLTSVVSAGGLRAGGLCGGTNIRAMYIKEGPRRAGEMSDLLPYQPSLASATNTRLDTACRHHQQCRVSTDDMLNFTIPKQDQVTPALSRLCLVCACFPCSLVPG